MFYVNKSFNVKNKKTCNFNHFVIEDHEIIIAYFVWLDSKTFINVETLVRFINNLHEELSPSSSKNILKNTIAIRLGYACFSTLKETAVPLNKAKNLSKQFCSQEVNNYTEFFFHQHLDFAVAVFEYLKVKFPKSAELDTDKFFNLFGSLYQNIILLDIFYDSYLDQDQIKRLIRICCAWYFRNVIPYDLMKSASIGFTKAAKAKFYKYKVEVIH